MTSEGMVTTTFVHTTITELYSSNQTGDLVHPTTLFMETEPASLEIGIMIYIALMGLVLTMAISSNMLIIYCVVRIQKLRTITNIFICNLSVSDILLAAYVMPLKLHDISHYDQDWYEGQIHCKVVNFCPILVISSSIYTLVFISFERRQVIMSSLKRGKRITHRKLVVLIILIWMAATIIATPTLFEYSVFDKTIVVGSSGTRTIKSCGSNIPRKLALLNAVFVLSVSYVIPVILLTTNYTQVAVYVWKKMKWIKENLEPNGVNSSSVRLFRQRIRTVKLLVLVAVIFAISWLPFFGILFYAKATGNDASEDAAGFSNLLLLSLATFSTAYNFILYVIFNPSFKKAIFGVLRCTNTSKLNKDVTGEHSQSPESPHTGDGADSNHVDNANLCKIEVIAKSPEFDNVNTGDSR